MRVWAHAGASGRASLGQGWRAFLSLSGKDVPTVGGTKNLCRPPVLAPQPLKTSNLNTSALELGERFVFVTSTKPLRQRVEVLHNVSVLLGMKGGEMMISALFLPPGASVAVVNPPEDLNPGGQMTDGETIMYVLG